MYLASCQTGISTLFRVRSVTLAACNAEHWNKKFFCNSRNCCTQLWCCRWLSRLVCLFEARTWQAGQLSLIFPPRLDTRRHTSALLRSCARHWALDTSAPVWSSHWTAELLRPPALHFSRSHTGSLNTTVAVAGLGRRFGADNAATTVDCYTGCSGPLSNGVSWPEN